MEIQKLVAFGLAGAALLLSGASEAANPNLTSITQVPAMVSTDHQFSVKVTGTGNCALMLYVIDEAGTVTLDKTATGFGGQFPAYVVLSLKSPGKNKVLVKTVASQIYPSCTPGQEVETTVNAFQKPTCPDGWEKTSFDGMTGEIACVAKKPALTCKGDTQPFWNDPWPGQCHAGCQNLLK